MMMTMQLKSKERTVKDEKQIFQQFSSEREINFHQQRGWNGAKGKTTSVPSTKLFCFFSSSGNYASANCFHLAHVNFCAVFN